MWRYFSKKNTWDHVGVEAYVYYTITYIDCFVWIMDWELDFPTCWSNLNLLRATKWATPTWFLLLIKTWAIILSCFLGLVWHFSSFFSVEWAGGWWLCVNQYPVDVEFNYWPWAWTYQLHVPSCNSKILTLILSFRSQIFFLKMVNSCFVTLSSSSC
jgi:hypothetical protein